MRNAKRASGELLRFCLVLLALALTGSLSMPMTTWPGPFLGSPSMV